MSNGLMSVQNAGYNTNLAAAQTTSMNAPMCNGAAMNGSIFNIPNYGKDYSDDMMMPDFLKSGYGDYSNMNTQNTNYNNQNQPVQDTQAQQNYPQQAASNPAFSGESAPLQQEEYYNILNQNNEKPKSKTGKKVGGFLGALAPIAVGLVKVAKGTKLSQALSLKSLAVKVPLLALAGWCAGSLIDTLTNSKNNAGGEVQTQDQAQAQALMQAQLQQAAIQQQVPVQQQVAPQQQQQYQPQQAA